MNVDKENILFPTDYSEAANNALSVALNIAKRKQAILHILHVVIPKYNNVSLENSPEAWHELEEQNKKGLRKLSSVLELQYKITVKSHTAISYINAAECIEKLAEELSVNLIIMGTHGLSGARDFFMGSNTYTVIKNLNRPVLAIPVDNQKITFQNVLAPIRNVVELENKFKAITNFLGDGHAQIEFLGVASFNDFIYFDSITEKLNEMMNLLKDQKIEVINRNEFCEDIADFVIDYADNSDVELLIINPMIDNDWKRFSLGTHMKKILNHIKKPILCIKYEAKQNGLQKIMTTDTKMKDHDNSDNSRP